jgi:hypothetical protein
VLTITWVFATLLPLELVAVSKYVVELPGDTDLDPLVATSPIPGWMFTEVALATLQFKVDEAPDVMLLGDALNNVIVGTAVAAGGVAGVLVPETSTCVVALLLPEELEAVKIYNVLAVGATALVPLTATFPIPLSRLTLVAPVTLQLSVDVPPDAMDEGLALNEFTTGFCSGVVVGLAGKYIQPHVNTRINSHTAHSFLISLFSPFYCSGVLPPNNVSK